MGLIEDLQAARDMASAGRTRRFQLPAIPGWPTLLVDVRTVGQEELEQVTAANTGGTKGMARVLARIITQVLVDEDGDHIPFGRWAHASADPDDQPRLEQFTGGQTTLYDVAHILRIAADGGGEKVAASDVVLYLIPAENDVRLGALFSKVSAWLTDERDGASDRVLGE